MNPTVLVVDNSLFMREKLKILLEEAGCEVVAEAKNGLEGVEQFKKTRPDLVTMDIIMPREGDMDGVGAMKEILKVEPKAKVVMVTAVDQKKKIEECVALGAADYLVKPIEAEAIVKMIERVFHG